MSKISSYLQKAVSGVFFKKKTFFEKEHPIALYNKQNSRYYNGVYSFKRSNQLYLNDLLLEKGKDLLDVNNNLDWLDSKRGIAAQREYFFDNIYSPMKKWFKNRKIKDSDLFVSLVHLKLYSPDIVDDILFQLDTLNKTGINYSIQSLLIAKYKVSSD